MNYEKEVRRDFEYVSRFSAVAIETVLTEYVLVGISGEAGKRARSAYLFHLRRRRDVADYVATLVDIEKWVQGRFGEEESLILTREVSDYCAEPRDPRLLIEFTTPFQFLTHFLSTFRPKQDRGEFEGWFVSALKHARRLHSGGIEHELQTLKQRLSLDEYWIETIDRYFGQLSQETNIQLPNQYGRSPSFLVVDNEVSRRAVDIDFPPDSKWVKGPGTGYNGLWTKQ